MKKLLASYGRDDEFRAVAEQIIDEEEKKNNRVLARSLRKTLETGPSRPASHWSSRWPAASGSTSSTVLRPPVKSSAINSSPINSGACSL